MSNTGLSDALDRATSSPARGFVDLHDVLAELKVRHPGGTHVAVAVDGSSMSDRAAQVAGWCLEVSRRACPEATSRHDMKISSQFDS